jgi:hypothetical protein
MASLCLIFSQLWFYLSPDHFIAYHSQSVDLLWRLCKIANGGHYVVEDVIAGLLSCRSVDERLDNFAKFGVFWRLSEDRDTRSSLIFSRPIFLMLDALQGENPSVRRGGATWLKDSVRSYTR